MIVGDAPVAVELAQAHRFAEPEVGIRFSVALGAGKVVEAMRVGYVPSGVDVQVADFVAEVSPPRGEPILEVCGPRRRCLLYTSPSPRD